MIVPTAQAAFPAASRSASQAVSGERALVPMHPETTTDPQTLRWVTDTSGMQSGRVIAAPGGLGERLAAGAVAAEVTPSAVMVTLRVPLTWRREGAAIRTELTAALADPDREKSWQTEPADQGAPLDARLRAGVAELIDGSAGEYVRSHGGSVELVDVTAGCVTLRLTGACGHCPASAFTLHRRFEDELRRGYPELVAVELAHT